MTIRIEPAHATDYLNVAALDRLAWPIVPDVFIPDGEHIWHVWSDTATLLVARRTDTSPLRESNDIAGALVQFPTKRGELFLHKIMVHPNCRGTGIGTELMKAALAEVTYKPTAENVMKGDDAARMQKLIDALENIDDVQEVYTTAVMES